MVFTVNDHAHRRRNPMTGEWVLVSPHRGKRPWEGQKEHAGRQQVLFEYDESCYLCPGNKRVNGVNNPTYESTFVFQNDFAALEPDVPGFTSDDPLFCMKSERGVSRVICFSPNHSLSFAEMTQEQIIPVVKCWRDQSEELGKAYRWVQIFENKGAVMGCSNAHPHGQIWAQESLPSLAQKKCEHFSQYFEAHNNNMLEAYLERELNFGERIVLSNKDWVLLVPYWAAWPFETLLLPRFSIESMCQLEDEKQKSLADMMNKLAICYDNLFQAAFPYSMGWQGAPYDGEAHPEWTLHAQFFPPLLRSATVKKFMVGYEMFAEPQRDLTPEQAAEKLKCLSKTHYKNDKKMPC